MTRNTAKNSVTSTRATSTVRQQSVADRTNDLLNASKVATLGELGEYRITASSEAETGQQTTWSAAQQGEAAAWTTASHQLWTTDECIWRIAAAAAVPSAIVLTLMSLLLYRRVRAVWPRGRTTSGIILSNDASAEQTNFSNGFANYAMRVAENDLYMSYPNSGIGSAQSRPTIEAMTISPGHVSGGDSLPARRQDGGSITYASLYVDSGSTNIYENFTATNE